MNFSVSILFQQHQHYHQTSANFLAFMAGPLSAFLATHSLHSQPFFFTDYPSLDRHPCLSTVNPARSFLLSSWLCWIPRLPLSSVWSIWTAFLINKSLKYGRWGQDQEWDHLLSVQWQLHFLNTNHNYITKLSSLSSSPSSGLLSMLDRDSQAEPVKYWDVCWSQLLSKAQ